MVRRVQRGSVCEHDEDCYAQVERHRFVWAAAEDVTDLAVNHPGEYTAAVVFDMPHSDSAPIDSFTLQVCSCLTHGHTVPAAVLGLLQLFIVSTSGLGFWGANLN